MGKTQKQKALSPLKIMTSPIAWLLIFGSIIAALTAIGPAEKTLGENARIVYLHGVWVWAALGCFIAAGIAGVTAWVSQNISAHFWSRALGRTGLCLWITYLPISIWAMQTNWNGLYLAEPRWRLALIFAVSGLLLQLGITLLENPAWASLANIVFIIVLLIALQAAENVMHPPSPILNSDAPRIQAYFSVLLTLMLLAAWQVARWWRQFEPAYPSNNS